MLRRGALLFPLLVLLAGASLIREASVGFLSCTEDAWSGLLMRQIRPTAPSAVTLVEINDATTLTHVWPWSVADFAVFFHAAVPFEPDVIGVEPVLDAERGAIVSGEDGDEVHAKMLHDGILRAPKLVLGGTLGFAPDAETSPPLHPMPVVPKVIGDLSRVPEFTAVESWAEERYRLSTKPGWLNLPAVRGPQGKCPLLFRYRGQPVPAITLQLAMLWAKVTPDEVEVVLGSHLTVGKLRIPIDATGAMVVNFGATLDRISYEDLLLTREQLDQGETPIRPAALFTKRVLLLGRTDAFVRNVELPNGTKASPSEFIASALATIQTAAHPRRIGEWFDWTLVGVAAAASLAIPRSRATRCAVVVILAEAALLGAAVYLYRSKELILPGLLPIGLAVWILLLRAMTKRVQRVIAF